MKDRENHGDDRLVAFTGGRILTMDAPGEADCVLFRSGRIVATGPSELLGRHPPDERIDLRGRTLVPGFIDAHLHLSFGCFLPAWVDLNGCRDAHAIVGRLKAYAESHPDQERIVGFPWFDALFDGASVSLPELDALFPDRAVVLIHTTFHSMMANSYALAEAGIDADLPDPRSGFFRRETNGELSGVLVETACIPLYRLLLSTDTAAYASMIERSARELHPFGITAIHDPCVTPAAESAYEALDAEQRLPVSVLMMPHGSTLLDNEVAGRLDGTVTGEGDEWLRTGPVKVFGDGALQESTALSLVVNGTEVVSGTYRDDFQDVVIDAVSRGFQACVHCLGNRTVDAALDAFEAARSRAPPGFVPRPRLEHLNVLSRDQVERLAALDACACVQPQFLLRARHLNAVRFEGTTWFPYADLAGAGVVLAGGSDYPGGFLDARDVIRCCRMGATMSDGCGHAISPEQALPFEEWLWHYTAGAAYAGGQEAERGMIREGMVADFVILEGDLCADRPPVVDETWVAGRRVYARSPGVETAQGAGVPDAR
jgi:predicted amidohydrolase YtcJ